MIGPRVRESEPLEISLMYRCRRMIDRTLTSLLVALLAWSSVASAQENSPYAPRDRVVLKSGETLEGNIRKVEKDGQVFYVVHRGGVEFQLGRFDVKAYYPAGETESEYAKLRNQMSDTVDDHWKMQQWCVENRMHTEREYHLLKIIQLEPDHKDARAKLGYELRDNQWVHKAHFLISHGYQQPQKNRWRTPQGMNIKEQKERQRDTDGEWRSRIKVLRRKLKRNDRAAALRELRSIKDPAAFEAVAGWWDDDREQDISNRALIIEILGTIKSRAAQNQLLDIALHNSNETLVDVALHELKSEQFDQAAIVRQLAPLMSPDPKLSNFLVNRAGFILGELGRNDSVKHLINGLVTTHAFKLNNPSGNMNVGMSPNNKGLGGMSMGEKPKTALRPVDNPAVREALRKLTGEDFEYSEANWLNWYMKKESIEIPSGLRRDP